MKTFMLTLLSALALSISASFAGNTPAPVAQEEVPAPVAQQEIVAPQPKTCGKEEKSCDIAEPVKEEAVKEVAEEVAQNPAVQQSVPVEQAQQPKG